MPINFRTFLTEKELLEESSKFIKIIKYLKGLKPCGKGIAILTTDNPYGKQADKKTNEEHFNQLKELLKEKGKTYFQQQGVYGQVENSVVIIDVSKQEAAQISNDKRWYQDSFIWVKPLEKALQFQMVRGKKQVSTFEVQTGGDTQQLKNFFSRAKGRKYVIPFSIPDSFWD